MPERIESTDGKQEAFPSASNRTIYAYLRSYWDDFVETMIGRISAEKALHPDFRRVWKIDENLTWYQNHEWGVQEPPYKITFFLNDLSALDGCPWVCKFGNNLDQSKSGYRYFCVAYGDPCQWNNNFGMKSMMEWAKQFDHPTVMTYQGELVRPVR